MCSGWVVPRSRAVLGCESASLAQQRSGPHPPRDFAVQLGPCLVIVVLDAIKTVVYIKSLSSTHAVLHKTHYEAWTFFADAFQSFG